MIDAVHTVLVFYKLIVENQKDGDGKLIVYYRDENSWLINLKPT